MRTHPECGVVMGGLRLVDAQGRTDRDVLYCPATARSLLAEGMVIANQSALWRRSLTDVAGAINPDLHFAFDYDWFIRLLEHTGAACAYRPLGALRAHEATKTANHSGGFKAEEDLVRQRYAIRSWERPYQQLRRAIALSMHGHLAYVVAGLGHRLGRS